MAQHDYVIANGTGAAVRSDLNNALSAIVSNNSGATEPTPTYAYQWWADTTTGLLKIRNAANNAWVTVGTLASANLGLLSSGGTVTAALGSASTPGITFTGDTNTGIYSPGADQVAISTNGSGRLFVDSSGRVGVGTSSPLGSLNVGASVADIAVQAGFFAGNKSSYASSVYNLYQNQLFVYDSTTGNAAGVGGAIALGADCGSSQKTWLASIEASKENATAGDYSGALVFRTRTNGDATLYERLRLTSSGRLGIGTTSPTANRKLTLKSGGGDAGLSIVNTADDVVGLIVPENTTTSQELGIYALSNMRLYTGGTQRATIDTSGRLLVGTSSSSSTSPIVVQGYVGVSAGAGEISITRGGTPSAADQGLGTIRFQNNNGNTGAQIDAVSDGSWTAGSNHRSRLTFSTTADGASSPTERMRINAYNEIFFGTTSTTPNPGFVFFNNVASVGSTLRIGHVNGAASGTTFLECYYNGTYIGGINQSGTTGVSFPTSSDYRLKENIAPVVDALKRIKDLKPSRFNFISDPSVTVDGFLAHEVQEVVPEAVVGVKNAVNEDGSIKPQGIDQSKLVPLLTAALQEAVAKIESLEARLTAAGI